MRLSGARKTVWLNALIMSARNWTLIDSVVWKFFARDKSMFQKPLCRIAFRPIVPGRTATPLTSPLGTRAKVALLMWISVSRLLSKVASPPM